MDGTDCCMTAEALIPHEEAPDPPRPTFIVLTLHERVPNAKANEPQWQTTPDFIRRDAITQFRGNFHLGDKVLTEVTLIGGEYLNVLETPGEIIEALMPLVPLTPTAKAALEEIKAEQEGAEDVEDRPAQRIGDC